MSDFDVSIDLGGSTAVSSAPVSASQAPPEKPRSPDPHLGMKFWIQIDGVEVAGFHDCSPITIETENYEYQEGGLNSYTRKFPVRTKYSNITLKRGIDPTRDLQVWYMQGVNSGIQRKNISIIVYDFTGRQVRKWDLQRAYPCKWTGPELKADTGAVMMETLEIAHEGLIPSS
jgi:phage tail-like protein